MEYAAHQPPDGYAFVLGNLGPALVNPLISAVPYSMERDFVPVSLIATGPNILVVPAGSPFRSLAELLAAARERPGSLNFGTSGAGSMAHLGGELIMREAGVRLVGVPYKGGVLAVNDLIAGQLDMMVSDALPVAQHIRTARLRALAVTGPRRAALAPEVPTFAEAGLPGLVALNWWGVYLPAGAGKGIVQAYVQALARIMADSDLKERFAALGVEAQASTPEEFRSFIAAEYAKYSRLVLDNRIRAE